MKTPVETIAAIREGKEPVTMAELLSSATYFDEASRVQGDCEAPLATLVLELTRRLVILQDNVGDVYHLAWDCASYHSRC